nr:hypothetical protein CFP56_11978 [Quercus suber]
MLLPMANKYKKQYCISRDCLCILRHLIHPNTMRCPLLIVAVKFGHRLIGVPINFMKRLRRRYAKSENESTTLPPHGASLCWVVIQSYFGKDDAVEHKS